jgi:hypothetical protein
MIPQNYIDIMNKIRSIYAETGSKLWYKWEDFGKDGMNEYGRKSEDGNFRILFYWDSVHSLITPEGDHSVLGSRLAGNDENAKQLLIDHLGLVFERELQGLRGEKWELYIITK